MRVLAVESAGIVKIFDSLKPHSVWTGGAFAILNGLTRRVVKICAKLFPTARHLYCRNVDCVICIDP